MLVSNKLRQAAVAAALALSVHACGIFEPEVCDGPVEIVISEGVHPTFSWSPPCRVTSLNVTQVGGLGEIVQSMWTIYEGEVSPVKSKECPSKAISPPVTYGEWKDVPALPLIPGNRYVLTISIREYKRGGRYRAARCATVWERLEDFIP